MAYDFGDLAKPVDRQKSAYDFGDLAKPVAPVAPAQTSKRIGGLGSAIVEPIANMVTGSIAKPASDIAGLAAIPAHYFGMTNRTPEDVQSQVREGMTYQPRTQIGQAASEYNPLALAGKAVGAGSASVGGAVRGEAPATSMRGAMGNALEEAINQAPGFIGMKAAKITPKIAPGVRDLAAKGVTMTPGELLGGGFSRAEQSLQSLPVVGDIIKSARGKGVEQFGIAAMNDALSPIGKKVPKGIKGQEAIAYTRRKLGDAYESLLPKMTGDLDHAAPSSELSVPGQPLPAKKPTFRQEIEKIRAMGENLPENERGQLNRILDKEVLRKFTHYGKASGETLKNIESQLSGLSKKMNISENYDVRTLGGAISETQAALRRMIENVNPSYGKELSAINDGYSKFKIAQRAASSIGSKEGVFTPSQYRTAVKAKDVTKDKRAFSEGTANQQKLAEAGKSVLSDTVPDSGTAGRLALMDILLGGGGYAALGPGGVAAGLAAPALYSQPVLRAIQSGLLSEQRIMPAAIPAGISISQNTQSPRAQERAKRKKYATGQQQ